jgi:hypothetical protein
MKHIKTTFLALGLCSIFTVQAQDILEDKIKPAYFCELNTGFLAGETVSGWMHVKNGFTLGKFWNVSFVTGIEGHRPGIFIPLGFEGRFAFNHKKTSPFVSMSATYLQNTGARNYGYYYTQSRSALSQAWVIATLSWNKTVWVTFAGNVCPTKLICCIT